jgi:hypothetical protein
MIYNHNIFILLIIFETYIYIGAFFHMSKKVWSNFQHVCDDSRKLVYFIQWRNQLYVARNRRSWVNESQKWYKGTIEEWNEYK